MVFLAAFLAVGRVGSAGHANQFGRSKSMRLKLVIGASSLAAIVGAGLSIVVMLAFFSSVRPFSSPSLLIASTFFLPAAAIVFASIFVYRHTSRRRKLQAFMTAILATILTIGFFVLASILSARRNNEPPAPTSPIAVMSDTL